MVPCPVQEELDHMHLSKKHKSEEQNSESNTAVINHPLINEALIELLKKRDATIKAQQQQINELTKECCICQSSSSGSKMYCTACGNYVHMDCIPANYCLKSCPTCRVRCEKAYGHNHGHPTPQRQIYQDIEDVETADETGSDNDDTATL